MSFFKGLLSKTPLSSNENFYYASQLGSDLTSITVYFRTLSNTIELDKNYYNLLYLSTSPIDRFNKLAYITIVEADFVQDVEGFKNLDIILKTYKSINFTSCKFPVNKRYSKSLKEYKIDELGFKGYRISKENQVEPVHSFVRSFISQLHILKLERISLPKMKNSFFLSFPLKKNLEELKLVDIDFTKNQFVYLSIFCMHCSIDKLTLQPKYESNDVQAFVSFVGKLFSYKADIVLFNIFRNLNSRSLIKILHVMLLSNNKDFKKVLSMNLNFTRGFSETDTRLSIVEHLFRFMSQLENRLITS
eukprot:snap_masked-scaffold_2-processed-gene-19.10-mRNA-1 protein AED:1.00 eAED:1.00 QI:0/0/0/0/1/1/2/0/303